VSSHVYGAILVTRDREVAVIRGRATGKWSFPKGHGHSHELPLEACIRELKEETGINMIGVTPDNEIRFKSGTYFVFYLDEKLPLSPEDKVEVMDSMWVPIHRLSYLVGNRDIVSFSNSINAYSIINKIESQRGI
jgi:8-oxo-dGTP pyrophosphatase MutT (NUDIX family)